MIPGFSYKNILCPLKLDPHPLIDKQGLLNAFDLKNNKNQVLHMTDKILKESVLDVFHKRNLFIEKIDVWRWNLNFTSVLRPHTDGDFRSRQSRQVGINWSMFDDDSRVCFFDSSIGETEFEKTPDGRTHTFWKFNPGTEPLIIWNNKNPSLISPQAPHLVTGPQNKFRYSLTIKFKENPTYDIVESRLWDLRLDTDYWKVKFIDDDLSRLQQAVDFTENQNNLDPKRNTGISSYKLPLEFSNPILKIISRYSKLDVKSLRIFKYQPEVGAELHTDFDKWADTITEYALNIPLENCDNSCTTQFYRNLGDYKSSSNEETGTGGYLYPTDMNKVHYSSEFSLTSPTLIRTGVPHKVVNKCTSERKILSIRFKNSDQLLPTDIINEIFLRL